LETIEIIVANDLVVFGDCEDKAIYNNGWKV